MDERVLCQQAARFSMSAKMGLSICETRELMFVQSGGG